MAKPDHTKSSKRGKTVTQTLNVFGSLKSSLFSWKWIFPLLVNQENGLIMLVRHKFVEKTVLFKFAIHFLKLRSTDEGKLYRLINNKNQQIQTGVRKFVYTYFSNRSEQLSYLQYGVCHQSNAIKHIGYLSGCLYVCMYDYSYPILY